MTDNTEADEEALPPVAERGVVYLGRVPPGLSPGKVKALLSPLGTVTRVFLEPEDAAKERNRRKAGNNRRKRYAEGWIEFASRKRAKTVARSLNTTRIAPATSRRGGADPHAHDLWCLKYLKGFTWDHLREKIAYERRVRAQRLKVHVAAAKKSNAEYLDLVDAAKTINAIDDRKTTKRARDAAKSKNPDADEEERPPKVARKFAQHKVVTKTTAAKSASYEGASAGGRKAARGRRHPATAAAPPAAAASRDLLDDL